MKYLDEFRDPERVSKILDEIKAAVTRPWFIMEVCGGQTHSILRYGIDRLLPPQFESIHGPGCPVCVTPLELIDQAIAIAERPDVIFASFGDMLRVPGSYKNLFDVRAGGGDVRIVHSPLDAVAIARNAPDKNVVFFSIGFETTAPATALAVWQARQEHLANFFLLVAHMLVPPAMRLLLESSTCRIQAFLAAGHVCTVMGYRQYQPIVENYHVPIVVTGFEPLDILDGVLAAVRQLESGAARLENRYSRVVRSQGNIAAQDIVSRVFKIVDRKWRGIGTILNSGLQLRPEFADFDAAVHYGTQRLSSDEPDKCISGLVLQGLRKPTDCPAFGSLCTPQKPLGAPMVSSEGACAAYFAFQQTTHATASARGES
ncbi:MAG: hydrogenase formation protein HypD [Candidatus Zixiibacteriota bacterium]